MKTLSPEAAPKLEMPEPASPLLYVAHDEAGNVLGLGRKPTPDILELEVTRAGRALTYAALDGSEHGIIVPSREVEVGDTLRLSYRTSF